MQAFEARPPPLTQDGDGVLRVTGTRVRLDTIVTAYDRGATAEEIVDRYPTLDIASVYEVIAYLLRNRVTVDEYMAKQREKADKLQAEIEQRFPPHGLRARLLARRDRGLPE